MASKSLPNTDQRDVAWTADILDISEFDVFSVAYQAWYREPPTTRTIETYFVPYMYGGAVPFWVRDFTRRTVEKSFAVCGSDHPFGPRGALRGLALAWNMLRAARPAAGDGKALRA